MSTETVSSHERVSLAATRVGPEVSEVRDQYSENYVPPRGHARYNRWDWARIDHVFRHIERSGSVLEVGVGAGQLINTLARTGGFASVVGVDIATESRFFRLSEGVELLSRSVTDLGMPSRSFDTVVCLEVLEHLDHDDFGAALAELRRVCRGTLFTSVPFEEPEPLAQGHKLRFTEDDIRRHWPRAAITLLERPESVGWALLTESAPAPIATLAKAQQAAAALRAGQADAQTRLREQRPRVEELFSVLHEARAAAAAVPEDAGVTQALNGVVDLAYPTVSIETAAEDPAARETIARELARIGQSLRAAGKPDVGLHLTKLALEHDRSEAILHDVFLTAQDAGAYAEAARAVVQLERLYADRPAKERPEFLEKLGHSQPAQLSLLAQIPRVPRERIRPVRDRLLYVLHNSLPYSSGGYATRAHGVATGLQRAGWEVLALTRPGYPLDIVEGLRDTGAPEEDVVDGVPYLRLLTPIRRSRLVRDGLLQREYVTASADAIEAELRKQRPSVVMGASNFLTSLPALIAARRVGVPFIYEVRGLWEITRGSREPEFAETPHFHVHRILEAAVCSRADHVFALTDGLRDEMAERGVPRGNIDVLPNCSDPERFRPMERDEALSAELGIPADVPVIGYVGTFVDYEGLDELAKACGLLKREGTAFRLLLVGSENVTTGDRGPISERVTEIAQAQGFSRWLIMPGRVPHEDVERYYSLVDIAPFPRKPWLVCEMVTPMKTLEALAMEKAVVVSSVRALTEQVEHEHTGLVFDKGDVQSLAAALRRLIASPELRRELGSAGRRWVEENRTWEQAGRHLRTVAETLQACYATD